MDGGFQSLSKDSSHIQMDLDEQMDRLSMMGSKVLSENLFIFKWDYVGHDSKWVGEWMNELLNVIIGAYRILIGFHPIISMKQKSHHLVNL